MSKKGANSNNTQQPVTETFQAELASIIEKGKDMKGEKRENYQSIVQRIEQSSSIRSSRRAHPTS